MTATDNYSHYLLACHLTPSQLTHDASAALEKVRRETAHSGSFYGCVLTQVSNNSACFVSKRFHESADEQLDHVRIQYRIPNQLGLLERFHVTLKDEEVYLNMYDSPEDAPSSLHAYRECNNRIRLHRAPSTGQWWDHPGAF